MAKTIKDDAFEYVSVTMDSEDLSDEVLDKLLADEEVSQKWYEYHLISDCMKQKQQVVGRDADFMQSSLFTAALAEISREHQACYATNRPLKHTAVQPAANHAFKGFAVAASLAAVAVSLWQFWSHAGNGADMPVAAEKMQIRQDGQAIVPVKSHKQDDMAETVLPNAAKQLPSAQSTVRTENQAETVKQQQDIVQ